MGPQDYSDLLSSLSAVKPRASAFLTVPRTVWRRSRGPFGSLRRREPPFAALAALSNDMSLAAKGTRVRTTLPAIPIKPHWRCCHGAHCSLRTVLLLVRLHHKAVHGCTSIRKRRRRRQPEARLLVALLDEAVQRDEVLLDSRLHATTPSPVQLQYPP